jgi:hypothetical protein
VLRQIHHFLGLAHRQGERLVDHHMFARRQRLLGQWGMGVVGCGHHYQVNVGARHELFGAVVHRDLRPRCVYILRATAGDGGQLQAGHSRYQRGMKGG